jgi:hypothetical protein
MNLFLRGWDLVEYIFFYHHRFTPVATTVSAKRPLENTASATNKWLAPFEAGFHKTSRRNPRGKKLPGA